MTQEKFIAKRVIGNCLTWSKLKNLMERGGGVELTSTFKLKLDMFHRKLFLKNEDKSVPDIILIACLFLCKNFILFFIDEEKCHSWYKDIFVSSIPNFMY